MGIALVIGLTVLVAIFVIFFTNIGGDYSKKTDQQLLDLWPLHENNVRAAKSVGREAHRRALEKKSSLAIEMKKRGLVKPDYTPESEALDSMSRKLFSRGLDEIKSLAKTNDKVALYQLGMIFRGVKELGTSIKYISDSANLGYADAQYALGWAFLSEGSGVTRNACESLKWLKIAAEQGHVDAKKALDVALKSFSTEEVEVAFAEAKEWLSRKSAEAARVSSESLASSQNRGAHRSTLSVVIGELERLVESGDINALVRLGEMYYSGKEIAQDYQKAAVLFREAAKKGSPDAQLYLGTMCKNGTGMPKDSLMAMHWYTKAAEGGNGAAQLILLTRTDNP